MKHWMDDLTPKEKETVLIRAVMLIVGQQKLGDVWNRYRITNTGRPALGSARLLDSRGLLE